MGFRPKELREGGVPLREIRDGGFPIWLLRDAFPIWQLMGMGSAPATATERASINRSVLVSDYADTDTGEAARTMPDLPPSRSPPPSHPAGAPSAAPIAADEGDGKTT